MSAAATETNATPVVQPEVAQSTGNVEASDAFKDASEAKDTSVSKASDSTSGPDADTVQSPTQEEKVGKKETQITAAPITKGTLGYKAPGFVSQLRFKQCYCELGGEEPVHIPKSGEFFRGEKPEVANRTAAWSGHQGKGLFYIYKTEDTPKNSPGSVLNLAEATSVSKEGDKIFSFRLDRHKHTFEAKTQDERNSWLAAIESTHESAAKSKDDILNSQGYKDNMDKLKSGKSTNETLAAAGATGAAVATGGAAAVATTTPDKKEEKAEKQENKAQEQRHKSDAADDKKKTAKSRSRSNKRSSIFGSIMGKKDEKKEEKEEKKEEKAAATAVEKEDKDLTKEDKKVEKEAKKDEKAAAATVKKEEKQEEKAEKQAEKEAKKEEKEEQKEQKAAEKDAKKEEKEEQKADKKHDGEAAAAVGATGAGAAGLFPLTCSHDRPSADYFYLAAAEHNKSEKEKDSAKTDDGTEKAQSKRKSLFGIFDKAKSPKSEKKESEVMPNTAASSGVKGETKKAEQKAAETFKDDPVSAEGSAKKDLPATPAVTTANKDTKALESKTNGAKSEESTSPTGSNKRASILNTVFRRPSKQAKSPSDEGKKEEKKAAATPATVPETSEADKTTTDKIERAPADASKASVAPAPKGNEPSAIGDVVPDAINTGNATQTDAAKPVTSTA
ncbi:MAG: hypothetical protein Q9162_007012 [Coniocarpon cinnabarinum]